MLTSLGVLVGTLMCLSIIPNASSYSKYGRSCQDINCARDQVCIIAEDQCLRDQSNPRECGKYPTCTKLGTGGASCSSKICGPNEYCKTENGAPQCVRKPSSPEYESAGVSVVNGQRIHDGNTNNNYNPNQNPFANANAPPAPPDMPFGSSGDQHRVHTGSDLGYPPDPPRSSDNNYNGHPSYPHNSGYPPDPSYGNNYGYPPYPNNNRMPGAGNPSGYPNGQHYPAYPQQNTGGVQYPNYPYQNQKGSIYHRNSAFIVLPSILSVALSSSLTLFITFKS